MILRIILFICLLQSLLFSQNEYENMDIAKIDINTYLIENIDSTFSVTDIARFDSTDETLLGCYWFTAKTEWKYNIKKTNCVTGIYKDNSIIWISNIFQSNASVIRTGLADDLNLNGKIELIVVLIKGNWENSVEEWLIYDWDGNTGNIVNEIDELTGKSKINLLGNSAEFIDINLDGIYEIVGVDPFNVDGPKLTYSFQNNLWGNWGDDLQIENFYFKPANKLECEVNCEVNHSFDSSYAYNYKVLNKVGSKQNIFKIYLKVNDKNLIGKVSQEWFFSRGIEDSSLVLFEESIFPPGTTAEDIINNSVSIIEPTGIPPLDFVADLSLNSKFLPGIFPYYVQGETEVLQVLADSQLWAEKVVENIGSNSVSGFTVCPNKISGEINLNEFLDSLINYNNQSYALGWIDDEPTYNKYNNYLTNAKTALEQNNNNAVKTELQIVLSECNADSSTVLTSEAYALLYFNTEYLVNQLPEAPTVEGLAVKLQDSQGNLLQADSLHYYEGGWHTATNNGDGTFTVQTERATISLKMFYLGGIQHKSNVTVGTDAVVFQTVNTTVQLKDSQNNFLSGDTVKYYAGGWKHFGIATNGTASKELLARNYTFKMYYAGSNKNIVQNTDSSSTVTFHTVNTEVQLKDSQGNFLDGGTAEYYASDWKDFGVAVNGTANKELLARAYTFKMHYLGSNINIVQDLDSSSTVVFQTKNTTVQLKDSQDNFLTGDSVRYYVNGWQHFGMATNGTTSKELLPKNYTFKMLYGGTNKNIVQNTDSNSTITFQTVNAEVQLRDSQGNLLDGGFAKYYASGWKDFGAATNGIANKELLSRKYTFKMQYGGSNINHVQNLDTNTTVVFNTISVTSQLKDSQGNLLDGGTVEYYAAGWKPFGEATNGTVAKELLAKNYTFKILLGGLNTTKVQDVSTNNTVDFVTTLTTIKVKDAQSQLIENAEVLYYGGGWHQIGFTVNGEVTTELLARSITFKAKQGTLQKNKQQDTSTNNVVEIILE